MKIWILTLGGFLIFSSAIAQGPRDDDPFSRGPEPGPARPEQLKLDKALIADDRFGGRFDPFADPFIDPLRERPEFFVTQFDLRRIGLAKLADDGESITLALPSSETKTVERMVPVKKMRKEKRTRVVGEAGRPNGRSVVRMKQEKRTRRIVKDGETIEQQYTVQVPVTEWIQDDSGDEKAGDVKEGTDKESDQPATEEYEVNIPFTVFMRQRVQTRVPGPLKPINTPLPLGSVRAWMTNGLELNGENLAKLLAEPRPVIRLRVPWPKDFQFNKAQQRAFSSETLFLLVDPQQQIGW